MKNRLFLFAAAAVIATSTLLSGCNSTETSTANNVVKDINSAEGQAALKAFTSDVATYIPANDRAALAKTFTDVAKYAGYAPSSSVVALALTWVSPEIAKIDPKLAAAIPTIESDYAIIQPFLTQGDTNLNTLASLIANPTTTATAATTATP